MTKNINQQYQELLFNILEKGYKYTDTKRNVKCLQIDSATLHIDMTDGFPALTTKRLYWKGVVAELLWFLKGSTDIRELWEHNVHIWDKDWWNWASADGKKYFGWAANKDEFKSLEEAYQNWKDKKDGKRGILGPPDRMYGLGRIYSAQWRNWLGISKGVIKYVDQISNLIQGMQDMPMSRRHIVNTWNPAEMEIMALPPCHWAFECIVRPLDDIICVDGITKASTCEHPMCNKDPKFCSADFGKAIRYGFTLKWHQRSVDTFLGLPFNIASYALLGHIIEKLTGYKFLGLIGDLSNVHLYENSWDAARELVKRDPMKYPLPKLGIMEHLKFNSLDELKIWRPDKDFKLLDYEAYPNDFNVPMLAPQN